MLNANDIAGYFHFSSIEKMAMLHKHKLLEWKQKLNETYYMLHYNFTYIFTYIYLIISFNNIYIYLYDDLIDSKHLGVSIKVKSDLVWNNRVAE